MLRRAAVSGGEATRVAAERAVSAMSSLSAARLFRICCQEKEVPRYFITAAGEPSRKQEGRGRRKLLNAVWEFLISTSPLTCCACKNRIANVASFKDPFKQLKAHIMRVNRSVRIHRLRIMQRALF